MRKSLFFILLLSMIGLTNGAQAQIAVMDTSIVQYLERPETGGKVKVVQPAQLAKRVSRAEAVIKYDGIKVMPSPRDFVYKYFPIMTIVRLKIMPYIKRDLFNRLFPNWKHT